MHARLDDRDSEPEGLRDLLIRSPLDVAQHQRCPGGSWKVVDRRGQRHSQLGLRGWIARSRRPVDLGSDMTAALVEERQHLVQRQLLFAVPPAAQLLVGRVRDDAVEPGSERRLTAEAVDLPDHGPERVLYDFFRILAVAGDAAPAALCYPAILRHETLCRHRLLPAARLGQNALPLPAPRIGGALGLSFAPPKGHLPSSP